MKEKLYIILRIILGIIFIWASWDKILDPKAFARVVDNYALLPPFLVRLTAITLPWVEAICGVLLISGYFVKGSAFIVDILMIIFILAFVVNIYRGIDISCGCFSNTVEPREGGYFFDILRDLLILGAGGYVFFFNKDETASGDGPSDKVKDEG